MKLTVVCLLLAAAAAGANPVMLTVLNEVGITGDTLHWVELTGRPFGDYFDLRGSIIRTSTTECTLDCILEPDQHLVITSADISRGINGRGSFQMRSDSDFVRLTYQGRTDSVVWPRFPTGRTSAPALPPGGSIALWNEGGPGQQNWYVDSTPTPGGPNDDHSTIAGTVTVTGGGRIHEAVVTASGQYGYLSAFTFNEYAVRGLGAGRYQVRASVHCDSGRFEAVWPESVDLGYSATVTGIDFDFLLSGIAEPGPAGPLPVRLNAIGREVRLELASGRMVRLDVIDPLGRRVAVLHDAPLAPGLHRFRLPDRLAAGVYLIRLGRETAGLTARTVIAR